jgi:hypothetical protein
MSRGTAFVFTLAVGLAANHAIAQNSPTPSLPANWQQMPPTDFAAAIGPLFSQDTFRLLSQSEQNELKDHGRDLFLQIDLTSTTLNYQTIDVIQHLARYLLSSEEVDKAKTALLARRDNWAGQPYAELRAKGVLMMRLEIPDAVIVNEGRRWVQAGGTLQQVPQADLQYDLVRSVFSDARVIEGAFSVQWTGLINAPQSGDYTFFISPINVNAGFSNPAFKFNMEVSISGQTILTAAPAAKNRGVAAYQPGTLLPPPPWTSESKPVTLTAGTPAALLVTVTVDAPGQLPSGELHAMLFWQGPGIAKSLVPNSSLTLPNGNTPGLQGSYSWMVNGQPQSLTRTDPVIDCAWATSAISIPQNATISQQAADAMWQSATSTEFISSLLGPPLKLHPFLKNQDDASAGLTTARRQSFLDLLMSNPSLFDPVDAKDAVRFYQAFRMGTPGRAMDAFGAWSARHADLACPISDDRVFDGDNRYWLAALAIATTQQLPDQAGRLKTEFLQLPDGRCSLPVAYTLCYSYLGRQKLADWIAILDAKLADPTVTGDLRVNWILARAHAEEHKRARYNHYPNRWPIPMSWPLDGKQYLSQALQAAQTSAAKARVARELVGRLAAARQYGPALNFLKTFAASSPAAGSMVSTWEQQLNGFIVAQKQAEQGEPAASKSAYVGVLQARRARAAARGDADGVKRYDSLINAAQNTN